MSPISVATPVAGSMRKILPSLLRDATRTSSPVAPICSAGTNDRPLNDPPSAPDRSVVCAVVGSILYTRVYEMPIITPFLSTARSEEHTSELQSLRHLVCRLLLEKKKEKK